MQLYSRSVRHPWFSFLAGDVLLTTSHTPARSGGCSDHLAAIIFTNECWLGAAAMANVRWVFKPSTNRIIMPILKVECSQSRLFSLRRVDGLVDGASRIAPEFTLFSVDAYQWDYTQPGIGALVPTVMFRTQSISLRNPPSCAYS